jgi:hypothetical protein
MFIAPACFCECDIPIHEKYPRGIYLKKNSDLTQWLIGWYLTRINDSVRESEVDGRWSAPTFKLVELGYLEISNYKSYLDEDGVIWYDYTASFTKLGLEFLAI